MMNLVELGTTIWFKHENRIILSEYLLHSFVSFTARSWYDVVQFIFQEWINSSASMHSIICGGKGKPYVLVKKPVNS